MIVSRALSLEKAKISVPLLVSALFYDLSSEKTVAIPSQSERRERDLQSCSARPGGRSRCSSTTRMPAELLDAAKATVARGWPTNALSGRL